jgi:hypothetical protein
MTPKRSTGSSFSCWDSSISNSITFSCEVSTNQHLQVYYLTMTKLKPVNWTTATFVETVNWDRKRKKTCGSKVFWTWTSCTCFVFYEANDWCCKWFMFRLCA